MAFVVVGGVPGAGKSTAMRPYVGAAGVHVVDPDRVRRVVSWRPLVHTVHQLLVWGGLLLGPTLMGTLVVQDTATRRRRREALLRAALWRGWQVHLILVDVTRDEALAGQARRGRVSPSRAFDRHWRRWSGLGADVPTMVVRPVVVTRAQVAQALAALIGAPPGRSARDQRALSGTRG
jgi:hypothetical protein